MSPIRESERKRYPDNWSSISASIRARAQHTCECTGECGSNHPTWIGNEQGRCNAPNGKLIIRDPDRPELWEQHSGCSGCLGGDESHPKMSMVVLTVAHLDHIPEHNSPSNLKALCQRCHLMLDHDQHMHNAYETRRKHKAIGELPGLEGDE